jgi:hypothetical protein
MEHNHHEHNHHNHGTISKLKSKAGKLEECLAPIFAKAPHLPQNWRKGITLIAPWLALVFGILGLVGFLGTSQLGVLLSPLVALRHGFSGIMAFFVVLLNFVTLILAILAFSPLSEMRKVGWDYIFYAFITSSLATIIYFFISASGLRDVVVILIGAYILFEVRERYS